MLRHEYPSLRQGLVGAWCPSLGASGYRLLDRSGRNNHGTLTNMAGQDNWRASEIGTVLSFDGVDDYAQTAYGLGITGNTSFSLTCWAWIPTAASTGGLFVIGDSQQTAAACGVYFGTRVVNTISVEYAGNTPAQTNATISRNAWTHICVTKTPGAVSSTTQLYYNGRSVGALTGSSAVPSIVDRYVLIGTFSAVTYDGTQCRLDDIRVYNRALTAAEIRLLASRPGIGLVQRPVRRAALPRKAYVNVGGTWKDADTYLNVGGSWKLSTPSVNVAGTWK